MTALLTRLAAGPLARPFLTLSLAGALTTVDLSVQRDVQSARVPALEAVMRTASSAGSPRNLFAALTLLAAVGGPEGPVLVRTILVVLLPANVAVEGLKRATQRTRPDGDRDPNNASFPSSHAANVAAIAFVLWRRWPRAGWIAWVFATLVAYSRIYLNRHFLSDVLVGVSIGVGSAVLGLRWCARAGRVWVESGRFRNR